MSDEQLAAGAQEQPENQEMVDGCAIIEADASATQRSLSKMVAAFQHAEAKALAVRVSGDVMEFIKDLAKLQAQIRDGLVDMLSEHEERIEALEDEAPLAAVMNKEDAEAFIRVAADSKGLALALLDIKEFARKPHNAAEYETKIKQIEEAELAGVIERSDKAVLLVTELSSTDEEVEEAEAEEEGQQNDDGTTAPGGEG